VGRDHLSDPPQAQLIVATSCFLDHEVHRPSGVSARELWGGIEATKAEQPLRGGAADVGAVVVVLADLDGVLVGEQPGLDVELRGKDEGLLHAAGVHTPQDVLGALPGPRTGQVRIWASRILSTFWMTGLSPWGLRSSVILHLPDLGAFSARMEV
jgi:hypothetical protein